MSGWTIGGILVGVALGALTPIVWQRRGPKWGIRWISVALLPVGLALAGLLKLGNEFAKFVSRFVFSPTAWVGWAVLALAVLLWIVARYAGPRTESAAPSSRGKVAAPPGQVEPARRGNSAPAPADEFSDVEDILRRRGIS